MMRIEIDRSRCIAASNCIGMAPRVFFLDGTRRAIVRDPKGADDAALKGAAAACPTGAISLYDEATGERVNP